MGKQGVKQLNFDTWKPLNFYLLREKYANQHFCHPILPQVCPFYLADRMSMLVCEFLKIIKIAQLSFGSDHFNFNRQHPPRTCLPF